VLQEHQTAGKAADNVDSEEGDRVSDTADALAGTVIADRIGGAHHRHEQAVVVQDEGSQPPQRRIVAFEHPHELADVVREGRQISGSQDLFEAAFDATRLIVNGGYPLFNQSGGVCRC
jgi:hypothetical protein